MGAVVHIQALQLTETSPQPQSSPIQEVLDQYADVFQENTKLPPKRAIDHQIKLQPGTAPVNMRPYRLPHQQKNVMEDMIKQLLQHKLIRESISPYCSPAILVRKKDGTWRLCID